MSKPVELPPLYIQSDYQREQATPKQAPYRSDFRRDYARILHCPSFRRLQGKTQLFPGIESDFFRNRLTHSLEVAQVAKAIALRLNLEHDYFKDNPIDVDLIETAALSHDIGHPPFGHTGEKALDDCMKGKGGFEGNAQTLRILARLEKKKRPEAGDKAHGEDPRTGLGLTHRTLAAVLKYDHCIGEKRDTDTSLQKGYYQSEKPLVDRIKQSVLGTNSLVGKFKTIECQIMDLADDIAYSTYDLEDALKAGFVSPIGMISAMSDETIIESLVKKAKIPSDQFMKIIIELWIGHIFNWKWGSLDINPDNINKPEAVALLVAHFDQVARNLSNEGDLRTKFTSELVGEYIDGINVETNLEIPALSQVTLNSDLQKRVDVLKHLTYELVIQSPRLKTVEYRGSRIVKEIFQALTEPDGNLLLPDDYQDLISIYTDDTDVLNRYRAICDFIASMTDRYAVEFYGRLKSESAQTIFKPL